MGGAQMTDIFLRPDLTFTDGARFLPMPDLWTLAQEPMPTDAEMDAVAIERELAQLILNAMGGLLTAEEQARCDALNDELDRLSGIPAPSEARP